MAGTNSHAALDPFAAFKPDDLELISAVAAQTAIAVENARAHERLAREEVARANYSRFLPEYVVKQMLDLGVFRVGGEEYASDDFVEEWPQSGERLTKDASRRLAESYPAMSGTSPTFKYRRMLGGGDIINISSLAGANPHPRMAAYNASKAAVIALTKAVGKDLARTGVVDPTLNALAYEAFDRARMRARSARPYGGYFDGVPSFVKDNVDVAGWPTGNGSEAYAPRLARADSDFVRMWSDQGLTYLGKSRLPEFGFSASTEYVRGEPVRKPWHLDYSAGASSGGE